MSEIIHVTETVEVEGLTPWLKSGELTAILTAVAQWYDATDDMIDIDIKLKPWDVSSDHPGVHLRPTLLIEIHCDFGGYHGHQKLRVWRGATPEEARTTLDLCTVNTKEVGKEKFTLGRKMLHIPLADIEIIPTEGR